MTAAGKLIAVEQLLDGGDWKRDPASRPGFRIYHFGGVEWVDAPEPRRWHRCRPQTRAIDGYDLIDRCACGAIRYDVGRWIGRNSTRKGRHRR